MTKISEHENLHTYSFKLHKLMTEKQYTYNFSGLFSTLKQTANDKKVTLHFFKIGLFNSVSESNQFYHKK